MAEAAMTSSRKNAPLGISIKNLYKIFGPTPKRYLGAVQDGMSKRELHDVHGHVLGLRNINIDMPAGAIQVVLTAMDADVIKTYVELGMSVGIVASVALDAERDRNLRILDAGHLFQVNVTRVGLRRGAWLRGYAYSFIETFVPTLSKAVVAKALANKAPLEAL